MRLKMILQKIVFPNDKICSETELYYKGKIEKKENEYHIKKGEKVSFNTYFNSFSIEKWKKYTNLENLSLNLEVSGVGKVNIINTYLEDGELKRRELQTVSIEEKQNKKIKIEIIKLELLGNINFEIEGIENFKIYSGNYSTQIEQKNDIHIGICICTFKREEFVRRNVNIFKSNILENEESELKDKLDIYIVDNAQTLEEKEFLHNNISYIKNKNLGGAGGFTRGMIEATFRNNSKITHCILMDDDITIDANVIERTYALLSILKKEYNRYMVGGAMLLEDNKKIQAVSGEQWTAKKTIMRNMNLDLTKEKNILINEKEEEINYNGWWYCCIPTKIITKDNLPLPIFIHMDDVEYGIRNQNGIIVLNGIGVWHPSFVSKGPITNTYYNVRNKLILDSKYGKSTKLYAKLYLLVLVLYYLAQYKYSEAKLVLKGYKDFYLGIENFKKMDASNLHKELIGYKYPLEKREDINIQNEMKANRNVSKGRKMYKRCN